MMTHSFLRRNLGKLAVPAICIAILSFIGTQAFTGDRGLYARERLNAQAERLNTRLAALVDKRELLEKQIKLLRPDTLDPDMLDERVRAVLNFAAEGEITILRNTR
ncbi:hypothetical protein MNBD_ALPHA09-484 [hydrothermal vent metagenome]|uniref:Cell division protein DivIC (FtsB), stabilizes FtsL against RasP cleavage n=1 Tax=hydrothermal vent metagenome TaxID=652676 RepID=A0A3B0TFV9_9ZZZZ